MRFFLIAILAVWCSALISNSLSRDADVKLAIYESEQQEKLNNEQFEILLKLESKNDSKVSEFVKDWRKAYPVATPFKLQELRLIEKKINDDISAVTEFTLASRQKQADKLNAVIGSPFGGQFEAKPGL